MARTHRTPAAGGLNGSRDGSDSVRLQSDAGDAVTKIAPLVLFDLDGTLVDSVGDLTAALNDLRARFSLAPVALAQVRTAISSGARAILGQGLPELSEAEREAQRDAFLGLYRERIGENDRLFSGIDQVLAAIEAAGSRWGVVTNKREDLARRVVERLDLDVRCAILIGGDTLARCKPDPLPVITACQRLGVPFAQAVFAGDDRRDIEAGRGAGTRTLAVRWGFHASADDPAGWGADAVVDEPIHLLRAGVLSTGAAR
jgi:phosphoglycolate phosphatase